MRVRDVALARLPVGEPADLLLLAGRLRARARRALRAHRPVDLLGPSAERLGGSCAETRRRRRAGSGPAEPVDALAARCPARRRRPGAEPGARNGCRPLADGAVRLTEGRGTAADLAFVRCLNVLMAGAAGLPSPPPTRRLIAIAGERAAWNDRPPESWEHVMPYGVRTDDQRRLTAAGYRVRVAVPWGPAAAAAPLRRLAAGRERGRAEPRTGDHRRRQDRRGAAVGAGPPRGTGRRSSSASAAPSARPSSARRYGVPAVDLAGAAARARVLLLAVKPQDIGTLLGPLAGHVDRRAPGGLGGRGHPDGADRGGPADGDAGGPGHAEHARARGRGDERPLGRARTRATRDLDEAEALLSAVGRVRRVPESQQDAVTALSGSGPAYFFYLVEAMIDAGILLGLPRALAADLIVQTALGAAVMLRDSGEHPVQLREAVTSPGGTTIAAIRELERHGVRAALIAAIEAAHDRSVELGRARRRGAELYGRTVRCPGRHRGARGNWLSRGTCRQSVTCRTDTRAQHCRRAVIGALLPRTDRSACSIHPSLLSRLSPYALLQHVRVQLSVGKPAPDAC